jgi:hypothetical protein
MDEIRQLILALDNGLKILSTHYDSTTSNEFKTLNEQINNFEKRWSQLIDDLEQCSTRVNIEIFFKIELHFLIIVKKFQSKF